MSMRIDSRWEWVGGRYEFFKITMAMAFMIILVLSLFFQLHQFILLQILSPEDLQILTAEDFSQFANIIRENHQDRLWLYVGGFILVFFICESYFVNLFFRDSDKPEKRPTLYYETLNKIIAVLNSSFLTYLSALIIIVALYYYYCWYMVDEHHIKKIYSMASAGAEEALRFIKEESFNTVINSLNIALCTAIIAIIYKMLTQMQKLLHSKKQKNILSMMDPSKLKSHRIIIGYSALGHQMLTETISGMENKELEFVWWERKRTFLKKMIIIESDASRVPHVLGKHPLSGEIGYTKCFDPKEEREYYVPILIGDAQTINIQALANFDEAMTITLCRLSFDENLSILDRKLEIKFNTALKEERIRCRQEKAAEVVSGNTSYPSPGYVIPCLRHEERELLEDELSISEQGVYEIFQANEYIGFDLADFIKAKIDHASTSIWSQQQKKNKIMICGDLNVASIIEGLFLNKTITLESGSSDAFDSMSCERTVPVLCDEIILFDPKSNKSEDNWYQSYDYIQNHKSYLEKGRFADLKEIFEKPLKIKFRIITMTLMSPDLADVPIKCQIAFPVIDEEVGNYLVDIIEVWKPSLLLIGYEKCSDSLYALKVIERYYRWLEGCRGEPVPMRYDLILAIADPVTQVLASKILNEQLSKSFSVYKPYVKIGRELAMLEKLVYRVINEF